MKLKKGQISIEYLIIIGFVTFTLIAIMAIAYYYNVTISDRIKVNQASNFANEIAVSAETVYYQGVPSKMTLYPYLPDGVSGIYFAGKIIVLNVSTGSGQTQIAYNSKINLTGSISPTEGIKKVTLTAQSDDVLVSG